ncbi:Flp pilus assembly protein CpaB [Paenarthrobacter sp. Z7-10]|nr:Flp pilus assembly protein CpaB [Paenarthrobacter sp. Z7-10]
MKTRLLGGAAALVLAIIGMVLLATYVQAADRRAQTGMSPVEVLVVQERIAAGTPVDKLESLVKGRSIPKSAIAGGAVTDLSQFAGKVAGVDLMPGEQLLDSRLVDPASLQSPNEAPVPKGLEEVTLKLEPERVAGGQLKAGDTVGVFISYNTGTAPGTADSPATKLEFHKVLVTNVISGGSTAPLGGASQSPQPNSGTSIMITLAQSGKDATHTIHGAEFGKVYLSKENPEMATNPTDQLDKEGVFK